MTKKEIKTKIDKIESEIRNIQSYNNIEGYKKLYDQLYEMKNDYNKKIYPELQRMFAEAHDLKREYEKPAKEKLVVPKHIQDWFRSWRSGINFGYAGAFIKWISLDEKYVIITSPGGTSGQGTAMGSGGYYYSRTQHYLVKVIEGARYLDRGEGGRISQFEGRLTKEKFNEWMEYLKKNG